MNDAIAPRSAGAKWTVETLYNHTGQPRIWGDGSEVKMIVNECGTIDWNESESLSVNPWLVKHCNIRGFNIHYRYQQKLYEQSCAECGVYPGEWHEPGCDTATCILCGYQQISCSCAKEDSYFTEVQELGGPLPWSGIPVGTKEAMEYGFWCRWTLLQPTPENPHPFTSGWMPCAQSEQGARPDLNRIVLECEWDRTKRRWVKRQGDPTGSSEER